MPVTSQSDGRSAEAWCELTSQGRWESELRKLGIVQSFAVLKLQSSPQGMIQDSDFSFQNSVTTVVTPGLHMQILQKQKLMWSSPEEPGGRNCHPQSSSIQVLWSPLSIHLFRMSTLGRETDTDSTPVMLRHQMRPFRVFAPPDHSVCSSHLDKRDSPHRVVRFVRMRKIPEKRDAAGPLKLPIIPTR